MTKDEKACKRALKEYMEQVDKYNLDDIKDDAYGCSNKRYMYDAFVSGFYAGRDYKKGVE